MTSLPTPLEFASYVWYSQACALGVFFEFSDYKRWIERKGEYANVPSPILPSLKWLFVGLISLGVYFFANNHFFVEFCWTKEYENDFSFGYRVFYYYVAMSVKRLFYYNPFSMSTGAIVASGLGYNGKKSTTGEEQWDKIVSIYIWEVETATSPIEMLRYWNH